MHQWRAPVHLSECEVWYIVLEQHCIINPPKCLHDSWGLQGGSVNLTHMASTPSQRPPQSPPMYVCSPLRVAHLLQRLLLLPASLHKRGGVQRHTSACSLLLLQLTDQCPALLQLLLGSQQCSTQLSHVFALIIIT